MNKNPQRETSFSSTLRLGIECLRKKNMDMQSIFISNTDCLVRVMQFTILATAIYWLHLGKHLWFVVGVVCVVLSLLPAVLLRDHTLRTAGSLCVTTLLFAHIVLGMQAGLYETSTLYDKAMHGLGSGAIAGLMITMLSRYCYLNRLELHQPLFSLIVLGIVVSLGTLWEVFEFSLDHTGLFQSQRGLTDTMLDLIADMAGALMAISLFAGFFRKIGGTETTVLKQHQPDERK